MVSGRPQTGKSRASRSSLQAKPTDTQEGGIPLLQSSPSLLLRHSLGRKPRKDHEPINPSGPVPTYQRRLTRLLGPHAVSGHGWAIDGEAGRPGARGCPDQAVLSWLNDVIAFQRSRASPLAPRDSEAQPARRIRGTRALAIQWKHSMSQRRNARPLTWMLHEGTGLEAKESSKLASRSPCRRGAARAIGCDSSLIAIGNPQLLHSQRHDRCPRGNSQVGDRVPNGLDAPFLAEKETRMGLWRTDPTSLETGDRVLLASTTTTMSGSSAEHSLATRCFALVGDICTPPSTADHASTS